MLLETCTESSLTDAVPQHSVDVPITTTAVVQDYETLAVTDLQPCTDQVSMTDCCNNDIPQQSLATVDNHQLTTAASSSLSSRGKVSRSSKIRSTQMRRGRRKTASDAGRTATVCRAILPAAAAVTTAGHHSNTATMSSVDAKARLRAMILSGSQHQPPKQGTS